MAIIHEFFPEEYVQLSKELATGYHPKLAPILNGCRYDDMDLRIAHIASYCEVMLDGVYTLEERMKLCDILRQKLILLREQEHERSIIILQ